jgi:predicted DsbA family dithiol-disulfide isomerase
MEQKKIKVKVYSDYICPFCYIGFDRIRKLKSEYDLDVEWRPFELHPEVPKEGVLTDNLPFPKEYLNMVMNNVKNLADEAGITFKFSGKLPNSRLALVISEFARKKGKFDEFHELVFDKYWIEGKDIGDLSLLLELAESIGLQRDDIQTYIKSEEPLNNLKKSHLELSRYGINGVPTFFIGDEIVVGAQPYDIFQKAVIKALEKEKLVT